MLEHIDLQPLNTLALPARARYFCRIEQAQQLPAAIQWARARQLPLLVLGGGSNVVLAGDWPGLALLIALPGKRAERRGEDIHVEVAAGENWHALVQWALQQQFYGLENLTLIPGTAGAAPIQNIGAYGVELVRYLEWVRGWSLDENRERTLRADECELGYRDSIFKRALLGRFIVTAIGLRLSARFAPVLGYPALQEVLAHLPNPSAAQVEQAVQQIRRSKLPDPALLPNAGSFFKNPVVSAEQFARLRNTYAQIPSYAAAGGVKIPAAWLVDQCGWKGQRRGAVGVHEQQALVLVHYPAPSVAAPARELLALAEAIRADVAGRFGVTLELEPAVYGGQSGYGGQSENGAQ